MSADNYILIKEYKEEPRFKVAHLCASCDWSEEDMPNHGYDSLEEAVKVANAIVDDYAEDGMEVEYGIQLDILEKK